MSRILIFSLGVVVGLCLACWLIKSIIHDAKLPKSTPLIEIQNPEDLRNI